MSKYRARTLGEEIANAIVHGLGLLFSIAALILLIVHAAGAGEIRHVVSVSIFGAALVILYSASTLYHSMPRGRAKAVFRVMDHACIYVLIAGTYTPIVLGSLGGSLGWWLFGIVWGLAVIGIAFKILFINRFAVLSTLLYIAMGWLIVGALGPLRQAVGPETLLYLVLGGVSYTLGTAFFAAHKVPYCHSVWHVFVLAGSVLHVMAVYHALP